MGFRQLVNDQFHALDGRKRAHPAASAYEPLPYSGSVVMFHSTKWPEGAYFDFALSWRDLVARGIEVHRIPGNHAAMFTEPNVDLVASKLRAYLQEAQRAATEGNRLAAVGS